MLESIEEIWSRTYPNQIFEYQFLDDKIAGYYQQENRLSKMYRLAAALAIFLSCLGLYGLTSFMITERTKEAGLRKVLGAKVSQIVYLFSREFMLLIVVAFVIASPLAWYLMNRWLEGYTYHIDVTIWVFIAGGMMAMLIALTTIGYQTVKVAVANPVDSLRAE
jgi:ABC-type antimicrobial peptide transport system permease subunit